MSSSPRDPDAADVRRPAEGAPPVALLLLNPEGYLTGLNSTAEHLLGAAATTITGTHVVRFFPQPLVSGTGTLVQHALKVATSEGWFEDESKLVRHDGSSIHAYFCIVALRQKTGELSGFALIALDTTAYAQELEALQRRVVELERRATERLHERDHSMRPSSESVAHMSHDLRAPLNSILGFTDLLLQGTPGPLNAEQIKQLTLVRGSADQLLTLTGSLLDLTRFESGQVAPTITRFPVAELLDRTVESVRPLAENKGLALILEIQPALHTAVMSSDAGKVRRILLNLLSNAIKFTDHGQITLSARVVPRSQQDVMAGRRTLLVQPSGSTETLLQIRVTDTGMGVAPLQSAHLFEAYGQGAGDAAHQRGSAGLGLLISRQLAVLLGGWVELSQSTWGSGSTFLVSLPLTYTPLE